MRKIIVFILLLIVAGKSFSQPRDYNRDYRKHFFWGIAFAGTSAKMKMAAYGFDTEYSSGQSSGWGIWGFSGLQDG
jgi:hypothetical protein